MSRDILAPPLQRMSGNRCYRVNLIHEDFAENRQYQQQNRNAPTQRQEYVENDLYDEDDDIDEENVHIEELADSTYIVKILVSSAFYGGIIGTKGSQKRRLETETQTIINVPRLTAFGTTREEVVIKGKTRPSVLSAARKINLLVASLRKKMKITHFVGVALNYGDIRNNFANLVKEVLAADFPSIDKILFIEEQFIHLTFVGLVLLNDTERTKAAQLLSSCLPFLSDCETPIPIHVSGLEIMNDDPSAASVVYARVESPDLQKFGDRVLKHFKQHGLSCDDREHVKLHMTVLNNRYRRKVDPQAQNFDARELLKKFGNFDFGTILCNALHIHCLGDKHESDLYYKLSASIDFDSTEKDVTIQ